MDILREKVEGIKEDVVELKGDRDKHEIRITNLEVSNSSVLADIKNLIKSVDNLISMLKWGFATAFTTLLGFFIWFIQNK